jgi:hypothetical protein
VYRVGGTEVDGARGFSCAFTDKIAVYRIAEDRHEPDSAAPSPRGCFSSGHSFGGK